MKVEIDWQRAELVCEQLLKAHRLKTFPYNEAIPPQEFIPQEIKNDPLVHACFLFFTSFMMRGTIKSSYVIKQFVKMWEGDPSLFDPQRIAQWEDDRKIHAQLRWRVIYRADEIARFWFENAKRLVKWWEGDPRKIFEGVTDSRKMYRRITNKEVRGIKPDDPDSYSWGFLGAQEKIASMIAYFLIDAKLIHAFEVSPPVDFQNLRVLKGTEVIKIINKNDVGRLRYEQVFPAGIEVLERYCKEKGVAMVVLGDALWLLSNYLCSSAPGNMTIGRKENIAPIPLNVDWQKDSHVRRYIRSCGTCPIEHLCKWNIPADTYYQSGVMGMRERKKPNLLWPYLPKLTKVYVESPVSKQVPDTKNGVVENLTFDLFPDE